MAKIKTGLAFHCHHDTPYEYVYDYDKRVEYIKHNKPSTEQELRLKLFQLIPDELLPGKDSPEWEAYYKAWKAYDKAFGKEMKTLHERLCPNCPWDGRTIFSRKL